MTRFSKLALVQKLLLSAFDDTPLPAHKSRSPLGLRVAGLGAATGRLNATLGKKWHMTLL